ncbi:MAG: TldD/PmbA family protein [Candidatus Margulisbacteria bacterium]|jgi:PmbA protein|nr:TldD/PmbA family protein [Candidatus Margulisiibacteriota bacterium]
MLDLPKYLAYAAEQGADEAELYYVSGREESVIVRDKEVRKVESAHDRGLAIRVIRQKRAGFAYTSSLTGGDIRQAVTMALRNAEYAEADKFLALPPPAAAGARAKPRALQNYAPAAVELTLSHLAVWAKRAEAAAYACDERVFTTEAATAFCALSKSRLLNTRGVDVAQQKTLCGVSLEIAAQHGGRMEAAADFKYAVSPAKITPEKIGRLAAARAVRMLDAVPAKTGRYDLVLVPAVARDFLAVLSELFSAENVLRHKSLFRRKLGQQVAAAGVTLIDDPLYPGLSGSYLYDGEGSPARRRVLIARGQLKDYYYDYYSARKCGQQSGGNAVRGSIFSEPVIGPSNLYFQPGKLKPAALLKSIGQGVLIENIMGLHTADPVSGDFSFGASGRLIRGGRLAGAVKDMAIAGNLTELLQAVKACGADLEFSGHYGAPSVLITGIMVAGQ